MNSSTVHTIRGVDVAIELCRPMFLKRRSQKIVACIAIVIGSRTGNRTSICNMHSVAFAETNHDTGSQG